MLNPNDRQVGGSHYVASFQHWDYVDAAYLNYYEAQVTKYLARWRKKNGKEDVEKAIHYYEKLLALYDRHPFRSWLRRKLLPLSRWKRLNVLDDFTGANELRPLELELFEGLSLYRNRKELLLLRPLFTELLAQASLLEGRRGRNR
jgi:hypothetical protein